MLLFVDVLPEGRYIRFGEEVTSIWIKPVYTLSPPNSNTMMRGLYHQSETRTNCCTLIAITYRLHIDETRNSFSFPTG